MRPPLRIAILECDTPLPNTNAKYHSYGGVFESLLKRGARALTPQLNPDADLRISKYQVELHPETYPALEDIDAILITGSRYDSFADTPWIQTLVAFTAKVLAQNRVRVIAVCFGHQIVGRALGVQVGRNEAGWETAVTEVQLTAKGREVFRVETLRIHQMHRDIVFAYPPNVEELGSSPVCAVQGMYVARRLITVQGHPEFDEEIISEILRSRHSLGVFDDGAFGDGMGRIGGVHDGVVVSAAFLRFLLDG